MSSERLYASRPVKLPGGSWFVATSRSPSTRVVMEPGVLGDHARWLMDHDRPKSLRREVFGDDVLVPGPWPFGLKVPGGNRIAIVEVGVLSVAAGWLLTAWAVWKIRS